MRGGGAPRWFRDRARQPRRRGPYARLLGLRRPAVLGPPLPSPGGRRHLPLQEARRAATPRRAALGAGAWNRRRRRGTGVADGRGRPAGGGCRGDRERARKGISQFEVLSLIGR